MKNTLLAEIRPKLTVLVLEDSKFLRNLTPTNSEVNLYKMKDEQKLIIIQLKFVWKNWHHFKLKGEEGIKRVRRHQSKISRSFGKSGFRRYEHFSVKFRNTKILEQISFEFMVKHTLSLNCHSLINLPPHPLQIRIYFSPTYISVIVSNWKNKLQSFG